MKTDRTSAGKKTAPGGDYRSGLAMRRLERKVGGDRGPLKDDRGGFVAGPMDGRYAPLGFQKSL